MKKYTIFDLFQFVLTMVIPVVLLMVQIAWYGMWILGYEEEAFNCDIFFMLDMAPAILIYAIVNSHCLHFCKYHRLMMYGSLASYAVYYVMPNLEPLTHNIITWMFLFVALVGFCITTYRFTAQLYKYGRKLYTLGRAGLHRRNRQTA